MRKEWINNPPSKTIRVIQRDFIDRIEKRSWSEYSVREVYTYEGEILGYSKPIDLYSDNIQDLRELLSLIHEALASPILDVSETEFKEISDEESKQEKRKRKLENK